MGLFDRIDRTAPRCFLQPQFCDTVGVDLYLECARERGVDGGDVALTLASRRLSLALDSQLGSAHCHQHVALLVFGIDMNDPTLVSYVSPSDVNVVLSRIPQEFRTRVRDVFLSNKSFGVRILGSVRIRGRRDITLYSVLPPRVSLRWYLGKGRNAAEFGAPRQGQWPPWAVRRFLLYDTLLHELGHLQLVRPKGRGWKRKFASESLADEFATTWRREIYATPFDHPDPVHNSPTDDELGMLPLWERLDKTQRLNLVHLVLAAPHQAMPDLSAFEPLDAGCRRFMSAVLGVSRFVVCILALLLATTTVIYARRGAVAATQNDLATRTLENVKIETFGLVE